MTIEEKFKEDLIIAVDSGYLSDIEDLLKQYFLEKVNSKPRYNEQYDSGHVPHPEGAWVSYEELIA